MKTFAAALLAASAYGCALMKIPLCEDETSDLRKKTGSYEKCMYSIQCGNFIVPQLQNLYMSVEDC